MSTACQPHVGHDKLLTILALHLVNCLSSHIRIDKQLTTLARCRVNCLSTHIRIDKQLTTLARHSNLQVRHSNLQVVNHGINGATVNVFSPLKTDDMSKHCLATSSRILAYDPRAWPRMQTRNSLHAAQITPSPLAGYNPDFWLQAAATSLRV